MMGFFLLWTGSIKKKRIFPTGVFIPNALLLETREHYLAVVSPWLYIYSRMFVCCSPNFTGGGLTLSQYWVNVWSYLTAVPSNTRRWFNVVLMLGQRRRRWPTIKTTLDPRLVSHPHDIEVN